MPAQVSPYRLLRQVSSDMRLLGVLFSLLGVLPFVMLYVFDAPRSGTMQIMAFASTAMLVGPGAWYVVAASLIRRRDLRGVRVSYIVAAAQVLVVGCGIVLAVTVAGIFIGGPAALALFFMPALAGLMWTLRKAKLAMQLLGVPGHGFEVSQPVPAIKIDLKDQHETSTDH